MDDAPYPNSIFNSQAVEVSADYVLIVEWLGEQDTKTGTELADWIVSRQRQLRVRRSQCDCAEQVLDTLRQAVEHFDKWGTPIVHLEAHGHQPASSTETSLGLVGPSSSRADELLRWEDMGDALRPLNLASRFRLLVVGAACYGEGPILAIDPEKPMPFTAIVGFTDTVKEGSLRESIRELYRGLLNPQMSLSESVEQANRQRFSQSDADIRLTLPHVLAFEGLLRGLRKTIAPNAARVRALDVAARCRQIRDADLSDLPFATVMCAAPQLARTGLEQAWRAMFLMDQFPENERRFGIDYDAAIALAQYGSGA